LGASRATRADLGAPVGGRCSSRSARVEGGVTIFMDVELVSIVDGESLDAYTVTFDVIYSGETWCRSIVGVDGAVAAGLEREEYEIVRAARDALLELLAAEAEPVSFQLRLASDGTTVLARATPGS
jgi:hypothetical protein